jgi:hypothetical protein
MKLGKGFWKCYYIVQKLFTHLLFKTNTSGYIELFFSAALYWGKMCSLTLRDKVVRKTFIPRRMKYMSSVGYYITITIIVQIY